MKELALFSIILGAIVYLLVICIKNYSGNNILSTVCTIMFPVPILLIFFIKEKRKLCNLLLSLIWIPSLLWLVMAGIFTWDGISSRYYALFAGSLLSIPFSSFALDDSLDAFKEIRVLKWLPSMALATMFVLSFGINYYMFMYRDESIYKLDYRMNSGVYAGLHTTEERGKALEISDRELKVHTNENETVLFMETVPMAYMMTKALPCTPSTWDITLYSYGFNDDILLQKYFKAINDIPDKIIYIYTGRNKVLSIEKEDHKFNEFVNEHYELTYTNNEPLYYIKVYESNEK